MSFVRTALFSGLIATSLIIAPPAGNLDPLAAPGATMVPLDSLNAGIQSTAMAAHDAETAALAAQDPRTSVQSLAGSASALHVISLPGSYYLEDNIDGESGKNGIEIRASGVTLDLNGFSARGVSGSLDGIVVITPATDQRRIEICNGSVADWGGDNIDAASSRATRIHNIRVYRGTVDGIRVGIAAEISDCVFENIGVHAIEAGASVSVRNVTIDWTGGMGIRCASNAEIIDCAVFEAEGIGIRGGDNSHVTNCNVSGNGRSSGHGILLDSGATVTNCTVNGNGNTGIRVGNGSSVIDCTVRENGEDGIDLGNECTVRGCTSTRNVDNGLSVGDFCQISGNSFTWNNTDYPDTDGDGIEVRGEFNVIQDNTISVNHRGIDVEPAAANRNLIISNRFSQNGNHIVGGADDRVAPLVEVGSDPFPDSAYANLDFD